MKAASHQSATSRSLSLRSDGSDFEFDSSEFASNEPPISPTLYSFSAPWKDSASGDLVSPLQHSSRHLRSIALPPHQAPADAYSGAGDFASNKADHDLDEDHNSNGQLIQSADGWFGRRSLDSVNTALNKKHTNSSSLSLDTRNAYQLPLQASSISHKAAKSSLRGSPASVLESSPQSSPTSRLGNDVHNGKRRRRWSFSLDFWHSTPSNELDYHHHNGLNTAVNTGKTNGYGAAVFTEAHDDRCESFQKSPSKSSARSMSRPKLAIKREKILIHSTATKALGHTLGSKHCTSSPVSPAAAAGYKLHSVGYKNSSSSTILPMKKPMSPHAQHYEHQRARTQQLSRRTSLPYRHNLLASCFFPSSQPVISY